MDALKQWFVNVAIKTFGPSAIRGAILGLGGWLAAREGALTALGIAYDATNHIITINLDTLNIGLVALIPAIGAGAIKVLNYHAESTVKSLTGTKTPS